MKTLEKRMKTIEKLKAKTKARSQRPKAKPPDKTKQKNEDPNKITVASLNMLPWFGNASYCNIESVYND